MASRRISSVRLASAATVLLFFCAERVQAQSAQLTSGPVLPLYRALRNNGLDPQSVYKIREADIDREDMHLYLSDGVIGFTQSVEGRITGAYFRGGR